MSVGKREPVYDPKLGTVDVWSKDGSVPAALRALIAGNVRIVGHAHTDNTGVAPTPHRNPVQAGRPRRRQGRRPPRGRRSAEGRRHGCRPLARRPDRQTRPGRHQCDDLCAWWCLVRAKVELVQKPDAAAVRAEVVQALRDYLDDRECAGFLQFVKVTEDFVSAVKRAHGITRGELG